MLMEAVHVHDGCSKVGVVPSPHYAPRICKGGMIYINGRLLVGVSFGSKTRDTLLLVVSLVGMAVLIGVAVLVIFD
jgi:hypothetical protein